MSKNVSRIAWRTGGSALDEAVDLGPDELLGRVAHLLPVLHVAHVRLLEVDERLDVLLPKLEVVVRLLDALVAAREGDGAQIEAFAALAELLSKHTDDSYTVSYVDDEGEVAVAAEVDDCDEDEGDGTDDAEVA